MIGVDKSTGDVVLTIADHLDWSETESHLYLLQEKINTYLRFVESGEFLTAYPKAAGRSVLIDWVGKHRLVPEAENFFLVACAALKASGIKLQSSQL